MKKKKVLILQNCRPKKKKVFHAYITDELLHVINFKQTSLFKSYKIQISQNQLLTVENKKKTKVKAR